MASVLDPRNLGRLAYFAAVVETRAFTRAGERLGVTKAVVSDQVARLEAELGTTLLLRTTRRVQPTEAGLALYAHATTILREAQDAFAELSAARSMPEGTLRVAAPIDYGALTVVPAVAEFLRQYPKCRAELRLSDRIVDLLDGEIDLSVRVGWLTDTSSLHARRIAHFDRLLVASPAFGDRVAGLRSPDQLAPFPFIVNLSLREPATWVFSNTRGNQTTLRGNVSVATDSTQAIHAGLHEGLGLAVLPDFLVAADVAAGRLIHVLPEWSLPPGGIPLVFPTARFRPPRVTLFTELLERRIRGQTPDPMAARRRSSRTRDR